MQVSELTGAALDWVVAKCADIPFPIVYEEDGREVTVSPSTDWAQAGPIIDRERIELRGDGDGGWLACDNLNPEQYGPTPLVAAMRCYVASKLGETIEIPEELK